MIKVGQVYYDKLLEDKIVITWISDDRNRFFCVRTDGFFMYGKDIGKEMKLIAEYPTWKEAVNSKEFSQ